MNTDIRLKVQDDDDDDYMNTYMNVKMTEITHNTVHARRLV